MSARNQLSPAGLGGPPARKKPVIPPPPRPTVSSPPAPVPTTDAEPVAPAAAPPAPSHSAAQEMPRRTKRGVSRRAPAGSPDSSIPISLLLPVEQANWVREQHHSGTTHANIILSAIAAQKDRLPALVAKLKNQTMTDDGLFVLSSERRVTVQTTQLQISTLRANIDTLDDLVAKMKASSRSELVRAALHGQMMS